MNRFAARKNNFAAGMNNFWVGMVTGMLLPVIVIAALLYATVDKFTGLLQDAAIAPLLERSEQTFDKVDTLLVTLDDKVNDAELKDVQLLAPLKQAQFFPELQALASGVKQLKQTAADLDKQAVLDKLQQQLQSSLQAKFPEDKAQQLAQSLMNIADVLAQQRLAAQADTAAVPAS